MNVYSLKDEDDETLTWAVTSDFIRFDEPCVVIPLSLIQTCGQPKLTRLIYDSAVQAQECRAEQTSLYVLTCAKDAASIARNHSAEDINRMLQELQPFLDAQESIDRAYFIVREAQYIQEDMRENRDRNLTPTQKCRREINRNRRSISNALTERDGYQCTCCGASENLEIDHIKPLSKNGGNDIENLQWLCRPCNLKKGTKHIDFRVNGGAQ